MKKKRIIISMLTLLCCCTGAWAQSTSDMLSGIFTINASGTTVQFSKGNLQYVNGNWQFAEHQYDYIGNNQSDNNKDLFAFNGYSTPDASWFNMSHDQWKYLLATRSVTNTLSDGARYTMATIGGTYKGLIIFPDDYTHPDGTDFEAGTYNGHSDFTATVSLEGWALMEAAGCVFLPAAGYYSYGGKKFGGFGEAVEINTTTSSGSNDYYTPAFKKDLADCDATSNKYSWMSVRLVQLKTGLQQDADGYYLIGSVNDWKGFAALVEILPKANAKMTADIDLGNDQTHISGTWKGESSPEHYGGIFDGQGHTLTVNYNDDKYFKAPFGHCYGATIKNLHVAGYIMARGEHPHTAGVMCNSTGNDVVQNVWVSATINTTRDAAGAIIGLNNSGASTIRDCLFTGTVKTVNSGGLDGCFLGRVRYGSSNIINCLSTGTFDYYNSSGSFDGTHTNCYVKQFDGTIPDAMQVTDAQLADGTTTANLQAGRSEVVWVQDPVTNQPMLATFANAVTLTDGDNLSALSAYAGKACKVAYSRSFTEGKSSTVCLPFAFAKGSVGTFYTFTGISKNESGEYIATMTEYTGDNLVANTPYLFTPSTTGDVDFSGTYEIPASITAGSTESGDWTYLGTYETISWTEAPTGIYGFSAQAVEEQGISQGQFVKVGAYVRIKPMRCYLKYKNGSANYAGARGMTRAADEELPETIKVRLIGADGEVTGIGSLQTKTGEVTFDKDAWYSLDGRRIEGKPSAKGIYVNNGKKVIIK